MNYRTLGTFGSFPSLPDEYDKADALILPIGYEGSTCYMSGTKFGPDAIIEASHYMEFYDIELDYEPSELVSIYTLKEPEFSKNSMAQAMCEIEKYMDCHTLNRKFVVTIGGEHSITPPIVNSFKVNVLFTNCPTTPPKMLLEDVELMFKFKSVLEIFTTEFSLNPMAPPTACPLSEPVFFNVISQP